MGYVGLAWPLLALVYPLWASIRAIEADDSSTSECKKLVAYWVLFSSIFLFELAFDNLLQWLPFWVYVKLVITCWLVIPNFNGALYVYKHLVSPCLFMDIKVLINKLNAKSSNFEDEVKRYVEVNGPEALEKLIASKLKCRESNVVVEKDVKTVQVAEQIKEVAAASEQVKFVPHFQQEVSKTGPDIMQTDNTKPETDLISSEKVEAFGESSQIPLPKQVQKEWTCAICQFTTESETILNSHLQGEAHKAACEELKTKTQQSKNKASTAGLEIEEEDNSATKTKRKRRRRKKNMQGPEEKLKSTTTTTCVELRENLCNICNISYTGSICNHEQFLEYV